MVSNNEQTFIEIDSYDSCTLFAFVYMHLEIKRKKKKKKLKLYRLIYIKGKADHGDDKLRTCEIKWLEPRSTFESPSVRTVSLSNDPFKTC